MPELKVHDHGLFPLPMQNPYSKLILGIKSLFVNQFWKVLLHILYYDKFSAKNCWENSLPPSKLNINCLQKFILKSQNQDISKK